MASGTVIVRFNPVPDNWCPSSRQDFVNMMTRLVYGFVENSNEAARIEFGNLQPGFCPETCDEFVEALNGISRGWIVSTGQKVAVSFSGVECCWNDPNAFFASLQNSVSAYVV